MSEIPADIRAKAEALLDAMAWTRGSPPLGGLKSDIAGMLRDAIAEALMAERERCAKIAGDYDSLAAQAILYEREAP